MSNLHPRRGPVRVLAAAHCALAVVLLIQPPALIRAAVGDRNIPRSWIIRTLGLRTLAQGAAETLRPRRGVLVLGVAVDLAHAASMVAAAAVWPRYRRASLISAGTAVTSAGLGAALAGLVR